MKERKKGMRVQTKMLWPLCQLLSPGAQVRTRHVPSAAAGRLLIQLKWPPMSCICLNIGTCFVVTSPIAHHAAPANKLPAYQRFVIGLTLYYPVNLPFIETESLLVGEMHLQRGCTIKLQ